MKGLKIAGLGIAIWGLNLLWPEAGLALTPLVMIGLVLALGAAALLYVLSQPLSSGHDGDGVGQDHPSHPIPVVVTR